MTPPLKQTQLRREREITLLEIKILGFRSSLVYHLCKLPLQSTNKDPVSKADRVLRAIQLPEVLTEVPTDLISEVSNLRVLRDLVPFQMPQAPKTQELTNKPQALQDNHVFENMPSLQSRV